ncbi:MAG TPA: hypothetical protein VFQ91_00695 [Bryobacteraceae bacterium]|nr:hypothetical protein [Bryobacteraceae bacterium]
MSTRFLLFLALTLLVCAQTPPEPQQKGVQSITIPQPFVMKSDGGPQPSPWTTWGPFVASGVSVIVSLGAVWLTQRNNQWVLEQQNAHTLKLSEQERAHDYIQAKRTRRAEWKRETYSHIAETLTGLMVDVDRISRAAGRLFANDVESPGDDEDRKLCKEMLESIEKRTEKLSGLELTSCGLVCDKTNDTLSAFIESWSELSSDFFHADCKEPDAIRRLIVYTLADLRQHVRTDLD